MLTLHLESSTDAAVAAKDKLLDADNEAQPVSIEKHEKADAKKLEDEKACEKGLWGYSPFGQEQNKECLDKKNTLPIFLFFVFCFCFCFCFCFFIMIVMTIVSNLDHK